MGRSGRRTGCRLARRGTGRPPAGARRVTDHIDLLLLVLVVLAIGPRVRLPFLGHQAAGHGAIGPQVGTSATISSSRWPTRSTFVGLQWLPVDIAPTTTRRRQRKCEAEWCRCKKEDRQNRRRQRYSTAQH